MHKNDLTSCSPFLTNQQMNKVFSIDGSVLGANESGQFNIILK